MPSELGASIGRFGLIAAGGYAFGPVGAAAGAVLGSFLFASSGPKIEGPRLGWQHPLVMGALGGGLLGLTVFILVEKHSPNPMLPLQLFRHRTFSGINVVTMLYFMAFFSFLIGVLVLLYPENFEQIFT